MQPLMNEAPINNERGGTGPEMRKLVMNQLVQEALASMEKRHVVEFKGQGGTIYPIKTLAGAVIALGNVPLESLLEMQLTVAH
jgi:hypothetical protein